MTARGSSDVALIRLVRAGDTGAFEAVVERYREGVFRIVARHVPRDAVAEVAHETFVRAYLSLDRYAPSRPFGHWLARIAVRSCCDHWRARPRAAVRFDPSRDEEPAAKENQKRRDDRELLEWALGRLPGEDRMVLVLTYFEEQSVKECAALLGWSESKVKVRAHRARARLREVLEDIVIEKGRRA